MNFEVKSYGEKFKYSIQKKPIEYWLSILILYFHFLASPSSLPTHAQQTSLSLSSSLVDILLPHAPLAPAPPLMKPMATNGGMASTFFPPNFLLQMQQPLPHHHHPQQDHHGHGHGQHHPHGHHLLPPPPTAQLNPFLQDFGVAGAMAPPPIYPDGDDDVSNHHHELVLAGKAEQLQDGAAASDDEEGDAAGCGGAEKKRRLSVEQVRTLEKNFELGNKLEPERKLQLARALGLQPRQVAIWFQNRRARWKTKQLEKDYDALRRQLDSARAENDALLAHNNKLQAEIVALKGGAGRQEAASELINLNVKETEASCSNRSENSSEINLDVSRPPAAVESPMNRGGGGAIPFYASVGRPGAGVDIDQLLHSHSSSPAVAAQPKVELGSSNGKADAAAATTNFGSLLCGAVDEPPPFWSWADGHHHFH